MKSIAGSIVVLGACLLGAAAVCTAEPTSDVRGPAVVAAIVLAVFGTIITFMGTRDGK